MLQDRYIALLGSARAVIKADSICRTRGVKVRVIAVPESISSECGMCLEVSSDEKETFMELMKTQNIKVQLYDI